MLLLSLVPGAVGCADNQIDGHKTSGQASPTAPSQVTIESRVIGDYYWVVDGERLDRTPLLSPDGSTMAYLPTVNGKADDRTRLVVQDLASGRERDLTPEEGYSYTSAKWSPDGGSLAFVKHRPDAPTEVWRIDADGGNLQLLYRPLPAIVGRRGPAFDIVRWANNGQILELAPTVWGNGGPHRLIRADGGGEDTQLKPTAAWFGATAEALVGEAVFSPDDAYILHVVKTAGLAQRPAGAPENGYSLVLHDSLTSDSGKWTRVLASFPGHVEISPADISPDGEWITLHERDLSPQGAPQGAERLWLVRRDGGSVRLVTGLPADVAIQGLVWAKGGRAFLNVSPPLWESRPNGGLYELSARSAEARLLAPETWPAALVSASRDGGRLLVIRGGGENASLHLLEMPSAEALASPVPTPAKATPSPARGLANCEPRLLSAYAHWSGATGSLAGAVVLSNRGSSACYLEGRPQVELLDGKGRSLAVTLTAFNGGDAEPEGFSLRPGEQAQVFLVWSNWCAAAPEPPIGVRLSLPGSLEPLPVAGAEGRGLTLTPRCDVPEVESRLSVGPFAPRESAARATPTADVERIGLRPDELADVFEVTITDDPSAAKRTRTIAAQDKVRALLSVLAGAVYLGGDEVADKASGKPYTIILRQQDGSATILAAWAGERAPNVNDPERHEWWYAKGLDAAVAALLADSPGVGR